MILLLACVSLLKFKFKCIRAVGTLMGAIHGAIIGKISEQGYFCGASFGAVSGAFLSVEVSETFLRLWLSDGKRIDSLLYLVRKFALDWLFIRYGNCNHVYFCNNQQGDVLVSLVNGERVRERLGPVLVINPRQIHTRNGTEIEASFEDMIETGGCEGLPGDRVQRIPMIEITSGDIADSYGERIPCSVCLEEFQVGEKARTLPCCNHMFHPSCIDQWLIKCGSCPLCRRNL